MFYQRLKDFTNLTHTDQLLADYFISMKNHMNYEISSQKLADTVGVAQSSVIRFSKKLGYRSYKMMMNDLENDDRSYEEAEEIHTDESTAVTNDKIRKRINYLMDLVLSVNESDDIERAVDFILKARTIFCYGYLSTHTAADHLNELLQLFGFNSFCLNYESTLTSMRGYGQNDLLVVFSESGATSVTLNVARLASEKGMRIVAITNMKSNKLASYADIHIKMLYSEVKTRFFHYTEMMQMFFVVDCLILNIYKRNETKYLMNVNEHVNLTKNNR